MRMPVPLPPHSSLSLFFVKLGLPDHPGAANGDGYSVVGSFLEIVRYAAGQSFFRHPTICMRKISTASQWCQVYHGIEQ
ncbi:hypothetical protein LY76DRAFT_594906 [Colletotrichum caudatum]|nr:hypothetical protein LY76DRAFT_594906 [Colletotrichum caudatum]